MILSLRVFAITRKQKYERHSNVESMFETNLFQSQELSNKALTRSVHPLQNFHIFKFFSAPKNYSWILKKKTIFESYKASDLTKSRVARFGPFYNVKCSANIAQNWQN